ncbi:hypothetical protein IE53DRAFT_366096 [Violaceomyces palustris]|uniref:Uncharacterized protein n=1 Tax=Violaceomyces palustris TaxID=1673888 RepID=A0ACD0P6G7_9BASI|nr:hypothetical protein IE53DRAFT_366096 [Violaceomyces palustris]
MSTTDVNENTFFAELSGTDSSNVNANSQSNKTTNRKSTTTGTTGSSGSTDTTLTAGNASDDPTTQTVGTSKTTSNQSSPGSTEGSTTGGSTGGSGGSTGSGTGTESDSTTSTTTSTTSTSTSSTSTSTSTTSSTSTSTTSTSSTTSSASTTTPSSPSSTSSTSATSSIRTSTSSPSSSAFTTQFLTITDSSGNVFTSTSTGLTPAATAGANNSGSSDGSGVNIGAIIGGCAGGVAGLVILIWLILLPLRRRAKKAKEVEWLAFGQENDHVNESSAEAVYGRGAGGGEGKNESQPDFHDQGIAMDPIGGDMHEQPYQYASVERNGSQNWGAGAAAGIPGQIYGHGQSEYDAYYAQQQAYAQHFDQGHVPQQPYQVPGGEWGPTYGHQEGGWAVAAAGTGAGVARAGTVSGQSHGGHQDPSSLNHVRSVGSTTVGSNYGVDMQAYDQAAEQQKHYAEQAYHQQQQQPYAEQAIVGPRSGSPGSKSREKSRATSGRSPALSIFFVHCW